MHGRSRFEMYMLCKQTKFQSPGSYHLAMIGRFLSINQTKDCRLARTIAAHQPDVLAGIHLERSAAQHVLRAVRFVNIGKTKQHFKSLAAPTESDGDWS